MAERRPARDCRSAVAVTLSGFVDYKKLIHRRTFHWRTIHRGLFAGRWPEDYSPDVESLSIQCTGWKLSVFSVCLSVSLCVCEQIGCRTITSTILYRFSPNFACGSATWSHRLNAYCLWDKPEV